MKPGKYRMAGPSSRTFCLKLREELYVNSVFPFKSTKSHLFITAQSNQILFEPIPISYLYHTLKREFHNLITHLWRKYFHLLVLKQLHDYFIQYTVILTLQEQIKMLLFLHYLSVIRPLPQPQCSHFQGEITEHFNWSSTRKPSLSIIVLHSPSSSSGNFYHSCLNIQDNNATQISKGLHSLFYLIFSQDVL